MFLSRRDVSEFLVPLGGEITLSEMSVTQLILLRFQNLWKAVYLLDLWTQVASYMWPTWGPPGADRTMLAPWTLLSGNVVQRSKGHGDGDMVMIFMWKKNESWVPKYVYTYGHIAYQYIQCRVTLAPSRGLDFRYPFVQFTTHIKCWMERQFSHMNT